jgi:hypothetical protein
MTTDDVASDNTPADENRAPQKITSGVKFVLLLAAAAVVAVVWILWLAGQGPATRSREEFQQYVALGTSLVLLSGFLVWLTRLGTSLPLRGLLTGLLSGLSGMICLLAAVAALEHLATGAPPGWVVNDVLVYAPFAGVVVGVIGLLRGFAVASAAGQPIDAAVTPEGEHSSPWRVDQ